MSVTGASSSVASTYLSMSGDNAEAAIELFFTDPSLAAEQPPAPAPAPAPGAGGGSFGGSFDGGAPGGSFGGAPGGPFGGAPGGPFDGAPPGSSPGEDADAAMARALAAEDAARAEPQVRAADARRVESLMGGGGMMGGGMGGSYDGVGGVGGLLSGGSAAFFSGGGAYDARAAGTVDSATWTLDEDAPEGSASERKDKNLSDMFAAPKELMFHGPFQAARQAGKDSKRWLLVNIQSDADFACHALNRDVWGDEMVQSLVESGFVFWQQDKDKSDEARTYVERYHVQEYPHLAILDPRTGRKIWSKEGWTMEHPVTAESFLEIVMDFGDRNSFDKPPSAPPAPKSKPDSSSTTTSSSSSSPAPPAPPPSNKRAAADLNEDEALAAAIAASIGDNDAA
ncbi:hypothetical protein TeGR_g8754, partial [Tetraparma gracilis]